MRVNYSLSDFVVSPIHFEIVFRQHWHFDLRQLRLPKFLDQRFQHLCHIHILKPLSLDLQTIVSTHQPSRITIQRLIIHPRSEDLP